MPKCVIIRRYKDEFMLGHKSKNYSCEAELALFIVSLRQFIFFGYFFYIRKKKEILPLRVRGT